MELNKYQEQAMTTCMHSCKNISYMLLNLVGEVGELASKIAKNIRKENVYIGGQKELKGLSRLCFYPHFFDEIEEWDEEFYVPFPPPRSGSCAALCRPLHP